MRDSSVVTSIGELVKIEGDRSRLEDRQRKEAAARSALRERRERDARDERERAARERKASEERLAEREAALAAVEARIAEREREVVTVTGPSLAELHRTHDTELATARRGYELALAERDARDRSRRMSSWIARALGLMLLAGGAVYANARISGAEGERTRLEAERGRLEGELASTRQNQEALEKRMTELRRHIAADKPAPIEPKTDPKIDPRTKTGPGPRPPAPPATPATPCNGDPLCTRDLGL